MLTFLRDTVVTIVLAGIIFLGVQSTVQHTVVITSSMEPSLLVGQHLLINKMIFKFQKPQRGDIVVFTPPGNLKGDYIKRIIGLPGDSIEIKDGVVFIHQNGESFPLFEPYIKEAARSPFKRDKIPANEYFVLGDNRNNSSDSRVGWLVPQQNLIGKAWLSIWPPDEWGLADNYPLLSNIASP